MKQSLTEKSYLYQVVKSLSQSRVKQALVKPEFVPDKLVVNPLESQSRVKQALVKLKWAKREGW